MARKIIPDELDDREILSLYGAAYYGARVTCGNCGREQTAVISKGSPIHSSDGVASEGCIWCGVSDLRRKIPR